MSTVSVTDIEIFSQWLGFADPPLRVAKLTLTRGNECYLRKQFPAGTQDHLSESLVLQLLTCLSQPPVAQLNAALFDLPEAVLQTHYGSIWTDDHPTHLVRLKFSTGWVMTISATTQQAFMLPLKVTDSTTGTTIETFDPRLSRSIAALMPEGYLEKDRLSGSLGMLAWDLANVNGGEAQVTSQPEFTTAPPKSSDKETTNSESPPDGFDELFRIRAGQESPAEKAEAQRTGRQSERLLKRIPLKDVGELLNQGADPNVADDCGQTALMHAAFPPFNRNTFRLLVEAGADLEARQTDGLTGLHLACAGGEAQAVAEWVRAGADTNARTPEGATPLMLGANWPDVVRPLLAAGADVNAADEDGHTALVYAIVKQSWVLAEGQLAVIRAILEAGADVARIDREGITPLGDARRMVAQRKLEEEVVQTLHPGQHSGAGRVARRLAEAVLALVASASGEE